MTVCSYRDCRHRRWSAKLFFVSLVLHEHIGNTHFFFLLFFCHEISTMTVVCPSSKPEWTDRMNSFSNETIFKGCWENLEDYSFSLLTGKMLLVDAFHYNALDVLGDRLLSSSEVLSVTNCCDLTFCLSKGNCIDLCSGWLNSIV